MPAVHPAAPNRPTSHFTRFVSGFQAISTLIGVPLALASGYTLYRTNYAPESACSSLRASIVSMLDKNVDPATRRMLVKRDVEAFERGCGGFDPDAQAAFKALLASDKAVAQAAPAAKVVPLAKPAAATKDASKDLPKDLPKDSTKDVAKAAEPAKDIAKDTAKAELRPAIVDKKPEAAAAVAEAEAPAPMSDSRWLDAVRSALVEPPGEAKHAAREVRPETAAKPQPLMASRPGEPVLQPGWGASAPPPAQAAALPPPVPVSDIARAPADPSRPVPPGSVPTAQYANNGSWVGNIPFVGRIIEGSGN